MGLNLNLTNSIKKKIIIIVATLLAWYTNLGVIYSAKILKAGKFRPEYLYLKKKMFPWKVLSKHSAKAI